MSLLKQIGFAIGVGLVWFVLAAFIGFIVFEGLIDPDGRIVDIWPAALGIPAFFGGTLFVLLVRLFEGPRPLHHVSFTRAGLLGGMSGALLPPLFVLMTLLGFGDWRDDRVPWRGLGLMAGLMAVSFAAAGSASVWYARRVVEPPKGAPQASGR